MLGRRSRQNLEGLGRGEAVRNAVAAVLVVATISFVAFSGITEPSVKWGKNEIKVCWADIRYRTDAYVASFSESAFDPAVLQRLMRELGDEQKKYVQELIQREYSADRTGIHFTGWARYSANESCDALVFGYVWSANDLEGDSSIGYKGHRTRTGAYESDAEAPGLPFVFIRIPQATKPEVLTTVALHEFGHLAGLRHETLRKTPPRVGSRAEPLPNLPLCLRESMSESAEAVTEFDSESIMNRCGLFGGAGTPPRQKLSMLDLKTLRRFYSPAHSPDESGD